MVHVRGECHPDLEFFLEFKVFLRNILVFLVTIMKLVEIVHVFDNKKWQKNWYPMKTFLVLENVW